MNTKGGIVNEERTLKVSGESDLRTCSPILSSTANLQPNFAVRKQNTHTHTHTQVSVLAIQEQHLFAQIQINRQPDVLLQ